MFKIPDSFEPEKLEPKQSGWQQFNIENAEDKKRLFGIELGKGIQAFQAALNACGDKISEALIISQHWLNDPAVIAAKDVYLKTVNTTASLLDAEQLSAKLLTMAEEKNASNTFYLLDGKDRLKALELYAEIRGYTGKSAIDLSTKNFTFKQMVVKFVEPDKKEKDIQSTIEHEPIKTPLKLKLVS